MGKELTVREERFLVRVISGALFYRTPDSYIDKKPAAAIERTPKIEGLLLGIRGILCSRFQNLPHAVPPKEEEDSLAKSLRFLTTRGYSAAQRTRFCQIMDEVMDEHLKHVPARRINRHPSYPLGIKIDGVCFTNKSGTVCAMRAAFEQKLKAEATLNKALIEPNSGYRLPAKHEPSKSIEPPPLSLYWT